jgi:hypothetical protein
MKERTHIERNCSTQTSKDGSEIQQLEVCLNQKFAAGFILQNPGFNKKKHKKTLI